jgi:DNA-binding transcriptional regulator YhcF (GntR family)
MPQHDPVDIEAIIAYANTPDAEGRLPSKNAIARHFGIHVVTVRKALLADPNRRASGTVQARQRIDAALVLDAIRDHTLEHGWAPSQRDIAETTGLMTSRVNFVLRALREEGIIETGPHPRQIRIIGTKMVIPNVTM